MVLSRGIAMSSKLLCSEITNRFFSMTILAPKEKKFGTKAMAKTLHELMQHLGYKYYLAQGGDWGAIISRTIATLYPDNCLAIHINMLPCLPPRPWSSPFQFVKAITGFALPSVVYRNNPREQ